MAQTGISVLFPTFTHRNFPCQTRFQPVVTLTLMAFEAVLTFTAICSIPAVVIRSPTAQLYILLRLAILLTTHNLYNKDYAWLNVSPPTSVHESYR